jgi:hypothetical protein
MSEQEIINDFFRNYVEIGFKTVKNSVKLNPQHTESHRRTIFEACNVLLEHGIPFWTEVHLKNGCIPDIVAPTHITPIIEIMSTETEKIFHEKKNSAYVTLGITSAQMKFIDANKEFDPKRLF